MVESLPYHPHSDCHVSTAYRLLSQISIVSHAVGKSFSILGCESTGNVIIDTPINLKLPEFDPQRDVSNNVQQCSSVCIEVTRVITGSGVRWNHCETWPVCDAGMGFPYLYMYTD